MKRVFVAVILVAALLFLIPTLVLAQPPNISALDAAPAQDGSATVSWTTDEPSDSRVDYGTSTSSLDQSASDAASTTSHSLKLTGLQANTTYYYRVSSTDADNNTATSPPSGEQPSSFQMAQGEPDTTPPNISALDAAPAQDGSATVSWTTDEPSDSRVDYGTSTSSLDQSASDAASTTSHSLKLTGLQANTTYYYRVSSTDADNNTATSPPSGEQPSSFRIPPPPVGPQTSVWANILAWYYQEPRNWGLGILLFLGGLTGAAATAFGAVGGLIPGTAGKDEVDRLARELVATTKRKETYQSDYDAVKKDPNATTDAEKEAFEALKWAEERQVALSNNISNAKRAQYVRALPFYLLLGGAFATALAQDVPQALAIGAGWPTVWASAQLRTEFKSLNEANAVVTAEKDLVAADNTTLKYQNAALTDKAAKVEQAAPAVKEMQTILTPAADDPAGAGVGTNPSGQFIKDLGKLKILADQVMNRIST